MPVAPGSARFWARWSGRNDPDKIRMVKGSHIVVDKLYDHDRCYIFQNADGRICFAIPYEQNYTLIGTTDEDHTGDPGSPRISDGETDYLLAAVSEYFRRPVTREHIRWAYAGIRPLYDDGASKAQEATRDYVLKLDQPQKAERPCCRSSGARSPPSASWRSRRWRRSRRSSRR